LDGGLAAKLVRRSRELNAPVIDDVEVAREREGHFEIPLDEQDA